ncbi:hypothetical protein [Actinomadura formosensis]|uniref:hypothetical protein n=1 Tax=Actinomadura formosensis TaxID=60706 RepID=UPI000833E2F1|nr:hypothetical protein [Actinomadura formosensis]
MLASSTRLGDAYFMAIGPALIFLAVVFWVVVTLTASRRRPRGRMPRGGLPNRGPVQGGIIKGSPSQRSRRDPAPSVTHREVTARVEYGRAGEQAVREKEREEEAEARRAAEVAAGATGRPRRRLFGLRKPR